jgi:ABC-type branched-subunit amino acid transport system permease subunit
MNVFPEPISLFSLRAIFAASLLLAFALLPVAARSLGEPFYITLVARVLIFAVAASGLNLLLGYGGLVSFGHALFVGLGAYIVGILADSGIGNGCADDRALRDHRPHHRRDQPAHQRHGLHHDHAGFRADVLLSGCEPEAIWRR